MLQRNTDATLRKSSYAPGRSPSIRPCCIFTCKNQTGHAGRHEGNTCSAHLRRMPQLKMVTKDAMCQKCAPLSQNINKQCSTAPVLRSCFDLLQNTAHSASFFFFYIIQIQNCVFLSLLSKAPICSFSPRFTLFLIFGDETQ